MVIEPAWDAAKDAVIARAITIDKTPDRFGNYTTPRSIVTGNIGFVTIGLGFSDGNTVAAVIGSVNPTKWQVVVHLRLVVNHLINAATFIYSILKFLIN